MPIRYDSTEIGKIQKTADGFLRAVTHVAKVGVLSYRMADGSVRKEFVPPETLFDSESMETLKLKPLTIEHNGMVKIDPRNVKKHSVGTTGETVAKNGTYLDSSLVVTSEDGVNAVENEDRVELSCCYDAVIVEKPGSYNGQNYTHVQEKRIYNHLTLTKQARGGSDLRLRFDSLEGDEGMEVSENFDGGPGSGPHEGSSPRGIDSWKLNFAFSERQLKDTSSPVRFKEGFNTITPAQKEMIEKSYEEKKYRLLESRRRVLASEGQTKGHPKYDEKKSKQIKDWHDNLLKQLNWEHGKDSNENIPKDTHLKMDSNPKKGVPRMNVKLSNGIEYDVPAEVAVELGNLKTQFDSLTAESKVTKEKLAKAEGERDTIKTQFDSLNAELPKKILEGAQERTALIEVAKKVLPADTNYDSMLNDQIRVSVVKAKLPKLTIEGQPAAYVQACYDSVASTIGAEDTRIPAQRVKSAQFQVPNFDSADDEVDADVARQKMIERQKNFGKDK